MRAKAKHKPHPRLGDEKCIECRGYGLVYSSFTQRMERCKCRPKPPIPESRLPYADK